MSNRLDRLSVVAAFVCFGVYWGAWGASLPQIQRSARVDSGTLGVSLLLVGLGAICSMRVTGAVIDRLGPIVLPGSMVAMAITGVLPALARSGVALGAAFFLVGAADGCVRRSREHGMRQERSGDLAANHGIGPCQFFGFGVVVTSLRALVGSSIGVPVRSAS